ncbi:transcriptional repressor TCF25-domain-containing protein [Calycina marina]|uniref:Transcriptional repressor TCF25-domain-containing protein n=1 Tax=Calycina marina TaxID=1763456 RepID=A0A9P7YVG2_9HELO|nr:transcriptional repressor TCF25-domain-containing protein [Calycina marina]
MSSRRLRKIQQEKELEEAKRRAEQEQIEEEEDDSSDEPLPVKPSGFSAFAALEEKGNAVGSEEKHSEAEEAEPVVALASRSKKPKKKKKKAKKAAIDKNDAGNDSDEIETALRELNLKRTAAHLVAPAKTVQDEQWERICKLLAIQNQHLKVGNEMRNLFGRAATDNHDDAGGRAPRQRQRNQPMDLETALKGTHKPGQGLSEITFRRNPFIQGKDTWPKGTVGGLSMAIVNDAKENDGTIEFRFVHDTSYQVTQSVFHRLVEMGEPQSLITLLIKNPYHISTLIQVSKIAKDQGDHALSSDLLERALFTMGRAATSLFNTKLNKGRVRLDFLRPENRELWLAAYHYIKSLMMKGTYRTAFEWAKLLLSLDPANDPYCMRLIIHDIALRAHQFEWLLELGNDSHDAALEESMSMLRSEEYAKYHNTPSFAFAALQLRQSPKARKFLAVSMQRLPWLFTRLFTEINLDAPPSIWGIQPRTNAEELFSDLYVQQTKDLWNTPEATAVLMEIAHTIPKVDATKIKILRDASMTLPVVRAIYLDNTPSLMGFLPSSLLHRENNSDSDPIPPEASKWSYDIKPMPGGHEADLGRGEELRPQHILARIARLFPIRPGPDDSMSDEDGMNEAQAAFLGEAPIDMPPGLVQRMMGMIFGTAVPEDEENTEWESAG